MILMGFDTGRYILGTVSKSSTSLPQMIIMHIKGIIYIKEYVGS